MRRKTNFLKIIFVIAVLLLFLIILKETSKFDEFGINKINETETLTKVSVIAIPEIMNLTSNVTDNKTITILNETEKGIREEVRGEQQTKISQGETKSYNINNEIINVTLEFVAREYAIFRVNGEKTDKLGLGETFTTKEGITIAVLDIWVQDFEGGKREVDFLLG